MLQFKKKYIIKQITQNHAYGDIRLFLAQNYSGRLGSLYHNIKRTYSLLESVISSILDTEINTVISSPGMAWLVNRALPIPLTSDGFTWFTKVQ